jgi:hypothetical protein
MTERRLPPDMPTPEALRKMSVKELRQQKRQITDELASLDDAEARIKGEMARRRGAGYYIQRFTR